MKINKSVSRLACFFLCLSWLISGLLQAQTPLIYASSATMDSLWAIDTTTWTISSRLAPTLLGSTITGITGMAWDPCQQKTYAIAKLSGAPFRELVTIDLKTGICTDIGDLGAKFSSLTFDKSGILYSTTGNGASPPEAFFSINKANADTTLLTFLGAGADGEIVTYNLWNDLFFHWSGNGTVEYEKFLHTAPYTTTSISSGPPAFEIFGGLNLGANKFIVSTLDTDLRRVDTSGNFSAPIMLLPADMRGLVFGIDFEVVDDTVCANDTISIHAVGANVYDYDVIYAWGDGTRDTVPDGGNGSHVFTSPGFYGVNILLYNGVCEDDTFSIENVMVYNIPAVNLTPFIIDTLLCTGDTLMLFGTGGGTSQWFMNGLPIPGATTPSIAVTLPGIYNMTKTNLNGCTDSASVGVPFDFAIPVASIDSLAPDTTYVGLNETFLNTSTGFTSNYWTYGDGSPADTVLDGNHTWSLPGTYTLTVHVFLTGCSDSTTHALVVLDTVIITKSQIPLNERFVLQPAVPNPFSASATLTFQLPDAGLARLTIYNLMGEEIAILHDGNIKAGTHTFKWDGNSANGTEVASGVYFCTLEYQGEKKSIKLLLQR